MKNLGMGLSGSNKVDMFLFQLGSLLLNKKSMNFALREIGNNKALRHISERAVKMAEYMESGNVVDYKIFKKVFPFLPDRIIHIIALPISDYTKGILLVNWKYLKFNMKTLFSHIYPSILSIFFACVLFQSFAQFTFPQLNEILSGLNVERSYYPEFLFGLFFTEEFEKIIILLPVIIFCFLILFAKIVFLVKGAYKLQDRANLLRMLAVLPFSERLSILTMMSEKLVYKSEYLVYRNFTNLLKEGVDINSASDRSGLSSQLGWLMLPTFRNETSSEVILEVATLFEKRLEYLIGKTGHMLRSLAILFEAALFASCSWAFFSAISDILTGIML
ncbi:MAG: hypothetical protein M0R31_06190 [Candidatus Riflebacteria bacterium]|nr:hypothetical protein [Candidatus Riflebacteria bacterium]